MVREYKALKKSEEKLNVPQKEPLKLIHALVSLEINS